MEKTLFLILSAVAIIGALVTVTRKNPLGSAIGLIVTFVALSGLYFTSDAPFVGALQVLVYAGAIMVLVVFVIMLLNLPEGELEEEKIPPRSWALAFFSVVPLGFLCIAQILSTKFEDKEPVGEGFGSVKAVGQLLFGDYLLQFEVVSLLLLVAIVGAIVMAKKRL
ncbi:MAG: NADH-quinone oxidoreductase subunit J [Planctomycetes bacterium]|nr:NADH-quinone oxidoreductase subunit J [Planctomycetota bacterium]